jgi:DNA primase
MRYLGRYLDAVAFWDKYVELPSNLEGPDLPLVFCPNPDHDNTRSPAFQINIERPVVHCFAGCGISGSYAHAISIIEGVDKRTASRIIRKSGHIPKPGEIKAAKAKPKKKLPIVDDRVLKQYSYLPQAPLEYLKSRGINSASIARWQLGWNSESLRLVIPARDERGILRGLIERGISAKSRPKYLYSEDFPRNRLLFGACFIDLGMVSSDGIVLVEGSLDAIRLYQHGFHNVLATLGGPHELQRNRMARVVPRPRRIPRMYLMFDRDTAGVAAIQKVAKLYPEIPLYICKYPTGKFDPAELSAEEASRSIERAIPALKFSAQTGLGLFRSLAHNRKGN